MEFVNNNDNLLIFLDINMPEMTGIEFLENIISKPLVIFTTAYEEYALKGYELGVIDYLLKPFTFERFCKAIDRINQLNLNIESSDLNSYMLIKADYKMVKINLSDILYIEGMKDYLRIHTSDNKSIMTLRSFSSIMTELDSHNFIRIHKSYIISLNKITSIDKESIYMKNIKIPIGKSYKSELLNRLKDNKH